MDVDGTLTDGKIYMGPLGETIKAFNIKDGYGIHDLALPNDIIPVIITGRESDILLKRCNELGIENVYQGVTDKVKVLENIAGDLSEIAYIGDDMNDYTCMFMIKQSGGIVGCPHDAVSGIREIADFIAEHNGGDGAVREFIDYLIKIISK